MAEVKEFVDQMGRHIKLVARPQRVISLVPSQTSLLYYLGMEPIAQTLFCIHPESKFKQAVKIGGTKKLNLDKIRSLKPDLIIGNKEENEQTQIETLAQEFPVWMSDITNKKEALDMIHALGDLLDCSDEANQLVQAIEGSFQAIDLQTPKRCLYLIWQKPYMAVGASTYIHNMITHLGWNNLAADLGRYPELDPDLIHQLDPELILLSSEPFPFADSHAERIQVEFPNSKVVLVNGELFSWYGDKMKDFPPYANQLIAQLN